MCVYIFFCVPFLYIFRSFFFCYCYSICQRNRVNWKFVEIYYADLMLFFCELCFFPRHFFLLLLLKCQSNLHFTVSSKKKNNNNNLKRKVKLFFFLVKPINIKMQLLNCCLLLHIANRNVLRVSQMKMNWIYLSIFAFFRTSTRAIFFLLNSIKRKRSYIFIGLNGRLSMAWLWATILIYRVYIYNFAGVNFVVNKNKCNAFSHMNIPWKSDR